MLIKGQQELCVTWNGNHWLWTQSLKLSLWEAVYVEWVGMAFLVPDFLQYIWIFQDIHTLVSLRHLDSVWHKDRHANGMREDNWGMPGPWTRATWGDRSFYTKYKAHFGHWDCLHLYTKYEM